ncbi:glycosyltransferase family 4 protein [Bradyrhizobium yuanmingense]|uniref:glycosyltransferase family 4 protein n=1 Tax=Bradyrhizobium yuanmingense TaxID=108015 RepID=UPI0023B887A5|nr:glycosyltransferase family 4 protein [Bradyrhizobium yuanmingense]MDF0578889.1 glycosyltransferase family 4 protein [Bradyrhizobium yuanmingense]
MTVVLVDPSRFTQPYDVGLSRGLIAAGLRILWATRPLRYGEPEQLPEGTVRDFFYRRFDRPDLLPSFLRGPAKGFSHIAGLFKLMALARRENAGAIHFQWTILPIFDALAMQVMKRRSKIVLTVHDTIPFNGEKISTLQNLGFDLPIRVADAVIVHTETAARRLIERGHVAGKMHVIPHGPLTINVEMPIRAPRDADEPWVFTLFGQIKPYKGLDILVEAVSRVKERLAGRARVIVAGAAYMDIEPVRQEIARSGITDLIELRIGRLSEEEMAQLFADTDCFVFPYRQIDASGVYYLTAPLGKWMIASKVGIFADNVLDGLNGDTIPVNDPETLAEALVNCAVKRPLPDRGTAAPSWDTIGEKTCALYQISPVGE